MENITMKTRLHDGIYKSEGGGEIQIIKQWKLGPRNLITAIEIMDKTHHQNRLSYGDIGSGSTWLEINGRKITFYELENYMDETDTDRYPSNYYRKPTNKTEWCKKYIMAVLSGELTGDFIY